MQVYELQAGIGKLEEAGRLTQGELTQSAEIRESLQSELDTARTAGLRVDESVKHLEEEIAHLQVCFNHATPCQYRDPLVTVQGLLVANCKRSFAKQNHARCRQCMSFP